MASSQVEIASSSSPFGCILRDHNRVTSTSTSTSRPSSGGAAFQKNLKELVRDRLHTCISVNDHHSHSHGNTNFLNRTTGGDDGSGGTMMMMTQKQANLLDRWAARQAKDMVSELKPDEDAKDSENLAASSLVQIWEARLNHPPTPRPAAMTIPNPNQTYKPTPSSIDINPSAPSTSSGSCSFSSSLESDKPLMAVCLLEPPAPNRDEPPPLDSESTTGMSSSVESRRNSDAGGDSEKLRVADIIRKLACNCTDNGEQQQQQSVCHGGDSPVHRVERRPTSSASPNYSDQADNVAPRLSLLPQLVLASPRMIRGRQAFNDLLVQLEKERHAEVQSLAQRHVVSKFPQRGRIQSMLRLRIMQRGMGMAIWDHIRPPSLPCRSTTPSASDSNTHSHGSAISHLREIFTAGAEQAAKAPRIAAISSSVIPEAANSSAGVGLASTINLSCEDRNDKENASAEQPSTLQMFQDSSASDAIELPSSPEKPQAQETTSTPTDAACQEGTSSYVESHGSQETSQTSGSSDEWDEEDQIEGEEEEQEVSEYDDYDYTMDDWFSSISRPRSYWEDKRQAWYDELLSTTSDNDEIRKLLERRTVSSFLASDFRDRIDRLMVSRTELQAIHQQEEMEDSQESMGQLMLSYFQRHTHSTNDQAEAEAETAVQQLGLDQQQGGEEEQEGHREESPNSHHQYIDPIDYVDQAQSVQYPSPPSYVNEASHQEPGRVHTTTRHPPPPPPPQWPGTSREDRQTSTSCNGHSNSTEMELISDLRAQMEQLQREMSELRKSLHASMEMQLHQYHAYPNRNVPVRRDEMNLVDMSQKRRVCCICYEMPVDTFLYRCGHMCTCLKCAHELQWSSGKCPICRAPILDVVRAYLDS